MVSKVEEKRKFGESEGVKKSNKWKIGVWRAEGRGRGVEGRGIGRRGGW